jgi:hypothetical protein
MPRKSFESARKTPDRQRAGSTKERKSFRKRAVDAPTFDTCTPQLIHAIVCLCCTYGASPTFSYTRDGTALVVAVYFDNERYVDYLSGQDELSEWFQWLTGDLLECEPIDLEPYAFITTKKP